MKNFYITTTLPYVNADPHIGFAAEIIRADVIARYQRLIGNEVFFNTGTDEHGKKIYEKALENNKDPKKYCDEYATKFDDLKQILNLSYNNFIRTTDEDHIRVVQAFWVKCQENGYIYKKKYQVKYCVGCELEVTDSELVNGECRWHPGRPLELIEEDNYFFKFSAFEDQLLKLYKDRPDFVIPKTKQNEILKFVKNGLNDFSISRLKEKMPWGVPVPGDHEQVMYVWFDALVNYVSAIGWSNDMDKFNNWWPVTQTCGKDNLRQQAAMWQAMLMSVGIEPSKNILVFGFIGVNGQKMSKSLGNVINPLELVEKYGIDAVRYYLNAGLVCYEDADFSYEKFEAKYTADLANGLGNLVSRITNLIEKNKIEINLNVSKERKWEEEYHVLMREFNFYEAIKIPWNELRKLDEVLTKTEPWKKTNIEDIKEILEPITQDIYAIMKVVSPFIPETAQKVLKQLDDKPIKKIQPLFPRIS